MKLKLLLESRLNQRGNAVVMVLLVFLACSIVITTSLQTTYMNRKIALYDRHSMQAWQAADAGLAWAHQQLAEQPYDPTISMQGNINLQNGAAITINSTKTTLATGVEYTVTSTGTYKGATHRAIRKIIVLPPEQP